jgi:hypothetical protein
MIVWALATDPVQLPLRQVGLFNIKAVVTILPLYNKHVYKNLIACMEGSLREHGLICRLIVIT